MKKYSENKTLSVFIEIKQKEGQILLSNENSFVFEFNNRVFKYWIEDKAYSDFIAFIDKNPSPNFIKIKDRGYIQLKDTLLNFVELEKLTPFDMDDTFRGVRVFDFTFFLNKLFDEKDNTDYQQKLISNYIEGIKDEHKQYFKDLINDYVQLFYHNDSKYKIDIHWGNLMRRDNEAVIIESFCDPLSRKLHKKIISNGLRF